MSDSFDSGATDFSSIGNSLDRVSLSADRVSRTLSRAFAGAIVNGKSFDDTLRNVGLSLSKLAMSSSLEALMKGVMGSAGGGLSSLFGGGSASLPVAPFADGGIVSRPTFFGMGSGLGLMGERGAEAILPLARGPDGRLGVASAGAAASASPSVNISISTPDVQGFARSQVQIASALAQAVMRGQRAL